MAAEHARTNNHVVLNSKICATDETNEQNHGTLISKSFSNCINQTQ